MIVINKFNKEKLQNSNRKGLNIEKVDKNVITHDAY